MTTTILVERPYRLRTGRELVPGTVLDVSSEEYVQAIQAGVARRYTRPGESAPHSDRMIHEEALTRPGKDD